MSTDQENEESPIAKSHASGIINDEILKLEFDGISSLFEQSEEFGGEIKPIFSREVRWFVREKNNEIENWFNSNGSLFKKQRIETWFSFGFKAFGSQELIKRNFDMVTKYVLDQMPGVKFEYEGSYNFPGFIKSKYRL